MNAKLPLFTALVTVLASSAASADTISFDAIPAGKIPMASSDRAGPEHIAATEKVDGFFPASTSAAQAKWMQEHGGGEKYVYVFPSDAQAKAFATSLNGSSSEPTDQGTCLSSGWSRSFQIGFGLEYIQPKYKPGSAEWKWQQQREIQQAKFRAQQAKFASHSPPSKPRPVHAVRSERFVQGADGNATLQVVDAWIDTETLGVRLDSRKSVEFKKVATGMGGLEIYAARDGQQVSFFVTPPKTPEVAGVPTSTLKSIGIVIAQLPIGMTSTSSSECGFLNVNLTAEGGGQMASILATEFLQPQPEEEAVPSPDSEDRFNMNQMNGIGFGNGAPGGGAVRAVRTRPLLANLSISQMSTEKVPTISISFGWAGHDQQQRF